MSRRNVMIAALCLLVPTFAMADEPKRVTGRVLDPTGQPVVGASISSFWAANGLTWDEVVAVRDKEPEKLWHKDSKRR